MVACRKIDKIINDAMLMYQEDMVKEFSSYPDTPVVFSPEYQNNMYKMLTEHRRKINRVNRRKLVAALVVSLLIASMMLTAFIAREQIFDFFVKIFDDRTQLSTNPENNELITQIYSPKYMPAGYVLEKKINSTNVYIELWQNGNIRIKFFQRCSQNNDIFVDDEYGNYQVIKSEGLLLYYLERNDTQTVIWNYDGYNFQLDCPSEVDWDIIIKIITSTEVKE